MTKRKTQQHDFRNLDALRTPRQEAPGLTPGQPRPEYSELEQKKIARANRRDRRRKILYRLLAILVILVALILFLRSSYFDIQDIKVEGMSYYTGQEIITMSGATTGRNLIFDSGKNEIRNSLRENPYFKDVTVKRKLPSTLIIQVEERPQLAAVVFGDSFIIIDDEGTVLRKTDVDPKLTFLTGLTISKMTVGEPIDAEEQEILSTTLRMLNTMQDGDIYFKKIDVSKVVIRAYIYDNLIVKGTPSEIIEAIEKGDLQKVVADLFEEGVSRGTIKMGGSNYMSFTPDIDAD